MHLNINRVLCGKIKNTNTVIKFLNTANFKSDLKNICGNSRAKCLRKIIILYLFIFIFRLFTYRCLLFLFIHFDKRSF